MPFNEQRDLSNSFLSCVHCDEPVIGNQYYLENDLEKANAFCCQGCLTVYQILQAKGLQEYYAIKSLSGSYKRRSPVKSEKAKYLYMDENDFLNEFTYKNENNLQTAEFYLEGIHCLACLWLIEKLPDIVPGVFMAKLDIGKSVVTINLSTEGKLSQVANELNQLGYRPHALKENQDARNLKFSEEKRTILRIGIAAAGASNIMLYAVSIYAGATATYLQFFNTLTVLFAIPVLTYSAYPFYKNAWVSIRNKTLSIDVPISISLIVGGVFGFCNFLIGHYENYFDSLTTLVFLLLLSRYFLKKIQDKALSTKDLHYFYQSESVVRAVDYNLSLFEEVHPKYLKINDIIKIPAGDFIPADGEILKGDSFIGLALLTGEFAPVRRITGDEVFAGTENISNELYIKIHKIKNNTRLGTILKSIENSWANKAPIVALTDKVSKYFIASIFILVAINFGYLCWRGDVSLALQQSLTLLIVTCPCALALSVPLTFSRVLNQAADNGIIIKNEAIIQKLSDIKKIYFDKTGTLTFGKMNLKELITIKSTISKIPVLDIILSLESQSRHPVAIALTQYATQNNAKFLTVQNFMEIPGRGVSGEILHYHYEINQQGLHENNQLIATFNLDDQIRQDALPVINALSKEGLELTILSGDDLSKVKLISEKLGFKESQILANLTPEKKSQVLSNSDNAMMVGDGANDAIAFASSHVAVAVQGSVEMALKASDIYLVNPELTSIYKLIILGREAMKVIYRNLALSLLYNAVSILLVLLGFITPLIAAIIMPLSSLTVLVSSYYGTPKMRKLWK